jgi:hypothetical protein
VPPPPLEFGVPPDEPAVEDLAPEPPADDEPARFDDESPPFTEDDFPDGSLRVGV